MKKIALIIFLLTSLCNADNVFAADFLTGSNKAQVAEGETFDVSVYINSDGSAINSAEGSLSFPTDLVSVVSVSNAGSIFPIWVEQPAYSNTNGSISFNGGVPNPGFSGSRGYVAKVTFKAKKAGSAAIAFSSGNIYSNDGSGTDVLKKKGAVSVSIGKPAVVPVLEPVKPEEKPIIPAVQKDEIIQPVPAKNTALPPMPNVSSENLADGNEWFTTKNITLDWDVPSGVTAVQFSLTGKEDSIPTSIYSPAVNFTKIVNIANGVSYFHIRFKNSAGWGEVLHKKIMVDTILPGEVTGSSVVNANGLISLTAKSSDIHSGIEKYEVYIDGKKIAEAKGELDKDIVIDLPLLKTGPNKITIVAYDYAKNTSIKTIDLNSLTPNVPKIEISKKEIQVNEENNLSITTYPNTEVVIFIKNENGIVTSSMSKTGADGQVSLPLAAFETSGIKTIWASLNNDCADICVLSEKVTINVLERDLVRIPKELLSMIRVQGSDALPWVIAAIFGLLYLLTFKRGKSHKDIIQELNKAEIDVYKTFKVLKVDAKKYKAMLKRNKVDLSEKDQLIMENLEKDLDEAETYFAKRLEKIEMELE